MSLPRALLVTRPLWPQMTCLTDVVPCVQAAEFAKIMVPLFKQIAKCLNSSHFQVRWPTLAAPWLVAHHWMHALHLDINRPAMQQADMLLAPATYSRLQKGGPGSAQAERLC